MTASAIGPSRRNVSRLTVYTVRRRPIGSIRLATAACAAVPFSVADALLVRPRAEIADTSPICSAGRLLVVGLETAAIGTFAGPQAMVSIA